MKIRFLLCLSFLTGNFVVAQEEQKYFGQNKVQYVHFDWHYIQSEHFDVYFYDGGEEISQFVADVAEAALPKILEDFRHHKLLNRIPFIIYNSHNHFQQTNVIDEYASEGIGGVTEIFKNRITLPYEGDYAKFRHVIEHELVHAVMQDFMYGGSLQAYLTSRVRVQIPGWFAEGHAEYQSRAGKFYSQSDMFMRDAVVEGYLPPIDQLAGFGVYWAGPTIFRFMAEKYGNEKVGEFITKLRATGTPDGAFQSALGMELQEFSEKWAMHQRKIYFPDIANMVNVKELGKQLTRHDKDGGYYNLSPTLNPIGDKIAILTDRSGYFDIDLISSTDGKMIKKLASGERTPILEELHLLSPGFGWSPDGQKIVFSAKASDNDALLILDTRTGDVKALKWDDLEGVFGGSFHPDGKRVVFTGMIHGTSDVYEVDITTGTKRKLTNDVFSDTRPVYSRDGTKIAFVSDRRDQLGQSEGTFDMHQFDFSQTDIYVMNSDGTDMERITTDEMDDSWPEWGPDNSKLLFTSDRNGVSNLYVADLTAKRNYAVTNNLSGIFQPTVSQDGKLLTFSGFTKSGYDVFVMKNPFELPEVELPLTVSMKKFRKEKDLPMTLADELGLTAKQTKQDTTDIGVEVKFSGESNADTTRKTGQETSFRNYVFAGNPNGKNAAEDDDYEDVTLPESVYRNDSGEYRIRKYKIKFSPDLIFGQAGFNTLYGFQGNTQFSFSDMLGDHRMTFGTNLFFDLKNSSFFGSYQYLARRTDYGVTAFHTGYTFITDYVDEETDPDNPRPGFDGRGDSFVRFRYFGGSLGASRPVDKFNRIDFGVSQFALARETSLASGIDGVTKEETVGPTTRSYNTVFNAALTTDNSLFTLFGPFDGRRASIGVTASPGYGANGLQFVSAAIDVRKYWWFAKYYAFAVRGSGGATWGRDPQRFFVGGLDNWIAPRFTNGDILVNTFEDFLATFVSPVRGSDYYELQGTRYAVANMELRFPLIHVMQLGFPLPLFLQQIRGVTFLDVGAAWGSSYRYVDRFGNVQLNERKFNWYTPELADGGKYFQDIRAGYGFGIRAFLGFFVLRYDLAWNINSPRFTAGNAKHYFSIGQDF